MSVSALAVKELTSSSSRLYLADSLAELPDLGVPTADILADLDEGRGRDDG